MKAKSLTLETISLSQQQYVETIRDLVRVKGFATVSELAGSLDVSRPSASEVVKRLVQEGLAVRKSRHEIVLSRAGRNVAEGLEQRHQALRRFMTRVMVMDPYRADEIACRVEHCVDREFSQRLLKLADFLEREYPWTLLGIAEHVKGGETAKRREDIAFQV